MSRRERMREIVEWALREREDHKATTGEELTYEALWSRLVSELESAESRLPKGDLPHMTTLYRNVRRAVDAGRVAPAEDRGPLRRGSRGSVRTEDASSTRQLGISLGPTSTRRGRTEHGAPEQTGRSDAETCAYTGAPVSSPEGAVAADASAAPAADEVSGPDAAAVGSEATREELSPLASGALLEDDDDDLPEVERDELAASGDGLADEGLADPSAQVVGASGTRPGDTVPTGAATTRGAVLVPVVGRGTSDSARAQILAALPRLEARLRTLNARLAERDAEYGVRYRHVFNAVIKPFKRTRRATARRGRLWHIADGARRVIQMFEGRLRELGIEDPDAERHAADGMAPTPADGSAPDGRTRSTALVVRPAHPVVPAPGAGPGGPPAVIPSRHDVAAGASLFRVASVATWSDGMQRQWGELMQLAVRAQVGAVVAYSRFNKRSEDAQIRLRLLTPVLNRDMSYDDCAELWRRVFAGKPLGGARGLEAFAGMEEFLLGDIPTAPFNYRRKYAELSGRTLRRWHDALKAEALEAELDGREPVAAKEVLAHKYRSDCAVVVKRTPALERQVLALYREHRGDWSAAFIARWGNLKYGWDVSERTVQEIIRAELGARERAQLEGGEDAVDALFRFHILREANAPMDCWIMDHSFLKQEVLHPNHPEYADACKDFDFEIHAAVDRRYPGGHVERRRVTRLYLTLVMDAFTRRVLAIRLWDRAPSTKETMLVLREAIRLFGVPRALYTDNGSDFRSHALLSALEDVGIQAVFSMPYSPRGRGRIERMFRKIKQMIMPHIRGYYGGRHPRVWTDEDLDTLPRIEQRVWDGIERLHNQAMSRRRRQSPVQSWNRYQSARELLRPTAGSNAGRALLGLLQVKKDCVRQTFGIELNGRTYLGAGLASIPVGGIVWAYYDPDRPEVITLAVPKANGEVVNLGEAEYYDDEHPVGDVARVAQLEQQFLRERDADRARRAERAEEIHRERRRREAGETIAEALVQQDAAAAAALAGGRPKPELPAPAPQRALPAPASGPSAADGDATQPGRDITPMADGAATELGDSPASAFGAPDAAAVTGGDTAAPRAPQARGTLPRAPRRSSSTQSRSGATDRGQGAHAGDDAVIEVALWED